MHSTEIIGYWKDAEMNKNIYLKYVCTLTLVPVHLMNSFDVDPKIEKAIFIRSSKELKIYRYSKKSFAIYWIVFSKLLVL